jgi:hypothetical protein
MTADAVPPMDTIKAVASTINRVSEIPQVVESVSTVVQLSVGADLASALSEADDVLNTINITEASNVLMGAVGDAGACVSSPNGIFDCVGLRNVLESSVDIKTFFNNFLSSIAPIGSDGTRSVCNPNGIINCTLTREVATGVLNSICGDGGDSSMVHCDGQTAVIITEIKSILGTIDMLIGGLQLIILNVNNAVANTLWIINNVQRVETISIMIFVTIILLIFSLAYRSYIKRKRRQCVKIQFPPSNHTIPSKHPIFDSNGKQIGTLDVQATTTFKSDTPTKISAQVVHRKRREV